MSARAAPPDGRSGGVLLTACRHLALAYAVGLAVAEAALNSAAGQWHYAPM